MAQEKKEVADIQIRVSKETLEKLEAKGKYFDKSPGGIVSRLVDEHSEFEKSCPAAKPSAEKPIEKKEKPEKEVEKEEIETEEKIEEPEVKEDKPVED